MYAKKNSRLKARIKKRAMTKFGIEMIKVKTNFYLVGNMKLFTRRILLIWRSFAN